MWNEREDKRGWHVRGGDGERFGKVEEKNVQDGKEERVGGEDEKESKVKVKLVIDSEGEKRRKVRGWNTRMESKKEGQIKYNEE